MQLWESIVIALRALTVNKLRTVLTMLGIIIGVAAVIALISIGNGFRQQINEDLGSLGTNVLTIFSGRFSIFGPDGEESESRTEQKKKPAEPLTMGDAEALSDPLRVSNVVAVAPEYNVNSARSVVRGQQEAEEVSISGVTPEYAGVRNTPQNSANLSPQSRWTGGRGWLCWEPKWSRSCLTSTSTPSAKQLELTEFLLK